MIRLGIICPSEIAFRRFLPALQGASDKIVFSAIGIASPNEWFGDLSNISASQINLQQKNELAKAQSFIDSFGGQIVVGYEKLVSSNEIDAVYIPLPPALHFMWARKALVYGKHVFVEKPSTTTLEETNELIRIASDNHLALHENYMFVYHNQLNEINKVIEKGEIGEVRLYRITFGFPRRQQNDFRYNKSLGGGALLDAGGYCLKYANCLLGNTAKIVTSYSNFIEGFDVDMFGSATLVNDNGNVAQIAFGMDNDYRCDIEIWGSNGTITSNRILTAPAGFTPTYLIKKNQDFESRDLPQDDSFRKSIMRFVDCIGNSSDRLEEYSIIKRQSLLVEQFLKKINTYDN